MKKGFTLLEVIVVVALFSLLFAGITGAFFNADRSWKTGQNKLIEQRQARRVLDNIVFSLREANPDWVLNGTHYPVAISEANSRIDFYKPVFNASDNITSLKKVTFKIDPADTTQILKKEGTEAANVIATNILALNITCACSGCTGIDQDCATAKIEVLTFKNANFMLSSLATLRNSNMTVPSDATIEEPQEGEF